MYTLKYTPKTSDQKRATAEFNVYYVTHGILRFFNCCRLLIEEWIIWLITTAVDCNRLKRKTIMEMKVRKQTLEGISHGTSKEHENCRVTLPMA